MNSEVIQNLYLRLDLLERHFRVHSIFHKTVIKNQKKKVSEGACASWFASAVVFYLFK